MTKRAAHANFVPLVHVKDAVAIGVFDGHADYGVVVNKRCGRGGIVEDGGGVAARIGL